MRLTLQRAAHCQKQRAVDLGTAPAAGTDPIERAQIILLFKGNGREVGQDVLVHDPRRLIGLHARLHRKAVSEAYVSAIERAQMRPLPCPPITRLRVADADSK